MQNTINTNISHQRFIIWQRKKSICHLQNHLLDMYSFVLFLSISMFCWYLKCMPFAMCICVCMLLLLLLIFFFLPFKYLCAVCQFYFILFLNMRYFISILLSHNSFAFKFLSTCYSIKFGRFRQTVWTEQFDFVFFLWIEEDLTKQDFWLFLSYFSISSLI